MQMRSVSRVVGCLCTVVILLCASPVQSWAASFKSGVNDEGLKKPIVSILNQLDQITQEILKRDTIITSGVETRSGYRSLHPEGLAIDIRTRDATKDQAQQIVHRIAETVGPCYDVILESNHIHIEYDTHNGRCSTDVFSNVGSDARDGKFDVQDFPELLRLMINEHISEHAGRIDNRCGQLCHGIYRKDPSNEDGNSADDDENVNAESQSKHGNTFLDTRIRQGEGALPMDKEDTGNNTGWIYSGVAESRIPGIRYPISIYVGGDH